MTSPQLSSQFWRFVNKLDIPVGSSFSYRNQLGSYYERQFNTNETVPRYLQTREAKATESQLDNRATSHPISDHHTAF